MTTKRTPKKRRGRKRLTPEMVAAWHACDFHALHAACGLKVWQSSPLPVEICIGGVDADDEPYNEWDKDSLHWQRMLMKAAGWPSDCRVAYTENLKEAISWRDYKAELVADPRLAGFGTGTDLASLHRGLEEAQARVDYRKQLIDNLDASKTDEKEHSK